MIETRTRHIVGQSVPWTIAPPPPRSHRQYCHCATHGYYLHIGGKCVRCVTDELRRELQLETAARCPYCGAGECSH